MEKIEKNKVTNINQFEKLVELLEKDPSLAAGFRRGTIPFNFKSKWEEIATELNALGPPRRLADGWLKVWRDLKFKVKKKMVANKAECSSTGGGRFKQYTLSSMEEAVANLLQFQKQLNPEGEVQGIQHQNQDKLSDSECNIVTEEQEVSENVESSVSEFPHHELPECSINSVVQYSTPPSISKKNESRFLEEQNERDHKRSKREEEVHECEMKIKRIKMLIKEKELERFSSSCEK